MNLETNKNLLKAGFILAGMFWGLIIALILDEGIVSAISFLSCSLVGYSLGIASNAILDFCHHRDLINKD